jgi:hypothetical protein
VVFVQLVLVDVESFFLVIREWINKSRVVTKARLGPEAINGRMGSFGGAVSANALHVLVSPGKDMQMPNYVDALHDN